MISSLGDCEVCSAKAAKYKCPKCEIKSCSLDCVKEHKNTSGCDGMRNKSKFVSLAQFSQLDLVSDYRLLEGAAAQIDKCRRDKLKRSTRQGSELFRAPRLPKALQRLQSQCQRGGISLKILPPHFIRRKQNNSHYDHKNKIIKWDVELVFVHINSKVMLQSQPETTKLWQLIREQVELPPTWQDSCADSSLHDSSSMADDSSMTDDGCSADPFLLYRSVGYGGLRLYLKCEAPSSGGGGRRYHPVDLRKSIRSNLRGQTIVEHPVIHVAMKADECVYREPTDEIEVIQDMRRGEETKEEAGDQCNDVSIGQVWDREAAMEADPAAYREYFDFYLKYYTQKYARQTSSSGASGLPLPSPGQQYINPPPGQQFLSPPMGYLFVNPPPGQPQPPPHVTTAGAPAIPLPEFDQRSAPDMSPFAALNRGSKPLQPPLSLPATSPQSGTPVVKEHYPRKHGFVPKRSTALEHALSVKNKLNEAKAQQMREELRKSALVAYDDSDSE